MYPNFLLSKLVLEFDCVRDLYDLADYRDRFLFSEPKPHFD